MPDAVREPGNVPARAGPAHALLAGPDRRPASSAAAFSRGDDRKKLVEASAKLSKAPLFIDDTPSRTMHRDRRLRPAAEAQAEAGPGRDRLLAADRARQSARPAPGAGGQDRPATEGAWPAS